MLDTAIMLAYIVIVCGLLKIHVSCVKIYGLYFAIILSSHLFGTIPAIDNMAKIVD